MDVKTVCQIIQRHLQLDVRQEHVSSPTTEKIVEVVKRFLAIVFEVGEDDYINLPLLSNDFSKLEESSAELPLVYAYLKNIFNSFEYDMELRLHDICMPTYKATKGIFNFIALVTCFHDKFCYLYDEVTLEQNELVIECSNIKKLIFQERKKNEGLRYAVDIKRKRVKHRQHGIDEAKYHLAEIVAEHDKLHKEFNSTKEYVNSLRNEQYDTMHEIDRSKLEYLHIDETIIYSPVRKIEEAKIVTTDIEKLHVVIEELRKEVDFLRSNDELSESISKAMDEMEEDIEALREYEKQLFFTTTKAREMECDLNEAETKLYCLTEQRLSVLNLIEELEEIIQESKEYHHTRTNDMENCIEENEKRIILLKNDTKLLQNNHMKLLNRLADLKMQKKKLIVTTDLEMHILANRMVSFVEAFREYKETFFTNCSVNRSLVTKVIIELQKKLPDL